MLYFRVKLNKMMCENKWQTERFIRLIKKSKNIFMAVIDRIQTVFTQFDLYL